MRIVLPIVGVVWIGMTGLFAWNDYQVNLDSRLSSENMVAETFASSIRQPLIQGSFIEAKIRADSLLKNPQVSCVSIVVGAELVATCPEGRINAPAINKVRSAIYLDDRDKTEFASIEIYFNNSELVEQFLSRLVKSALAFAMLAVFIFIALTRGMAPVRKEINAILNQAKEDPFQAKLQDFRISEIGSVSTALRDNMQAASQVVQANTSLEVAKQVAHDIRSPLASLKMLVEDLKKDIPERYFLALQNNAKRIGDIANDLIERNIEKMREQFETVCVSSICKEIVDEKRTIYGNYPSLCILLENEATNSLVLINPGDFKRAISNLLGNSIEACGSTGNISIQLRNRENRFELVIADTGIGIPDNIVGKLFKPGATFGKKNGKGLGLVHAKSVIEAAGGNINVRSKVGKGTEIKITLQNVEFETTGSANSESLNIGSPTQIALSL